MVDPVNPPFPAALITPTGRLEPVRVWIHGDTVEVWHAEHRQATPRIVATAPLPEVTVTGRTWTAPTWHAEPTSGCACGHPVRRLTPRRMAQLRDS